MIDFKDEILNGEPRYNIRDKDGNLIQEDASIELSTEVTQEGTPLNKALFAISGSSTGESLMLSSLPTA